MGKQSIFLTPPEPFVKVAGTEMGDDSQKWEQEIISALHEAHPYLQSNTIRIVFNARDENSKTATGDIFVDNKLDIPFIIDKGELQPLDVFMHGGDLLPLSRRTVSEALMDTNFGSSIPAGSGETADVFNTNAIPPFDGKYTFASLLTTAQLKAAKTIVREKGRMYHIDPDTGESELEDIIKHHMDELSSDLQEIRRYDLQKEAAALPVARIFFDRTPEKLEPGARRVKTAFGADVEGVVFDQAYDPFSDYVSDQPIFHEKNGKGFATVDQAISVPSKVASFKKAEPTERAIGCFCWETGATFPVKIAQVFSDGIEIEDLEGQRSMIVRPTTGLKMATRLTDIFYIPENFVFHPCINAEIDFAAPTTKTASLCISYNNGQYIASGDPRLPREPISGTRLRQELAQYYEPESVREVVKVATHKGTVRIKAPEAPMEKTASVDAALLERAGFRPPDLENALDAIPFILNVDLEPFKKLGKEQLCRTPTAFAKMAVELSEEMKADTVDGILGANFLTEDTVMKFLEHINIFRKARRAALELLLAARLGLELPQGPIRAAAFALDDVVNSLYQLRRLMVAGEV